MVKSSMKEMKCHTNSNHKRAGMAILILDKKDFKMRNAIGDSERYFITIKISI